MSNAFKSRPSCSGRDVLMASGCPGEYPWLTHSCSAAALHPWYRFGVSTLSSRLVSVLRFGIVLFTFSCASSPQSAKLQITIPDGFVAVAGANDLVKLADVAPAMRDLLFEGAESVAVKVEGRRPVAFMRVSILRGVSSLQSAAQKLVAGAKAQLTARIEEERTLEIGGVECASVVWARGRDATETRIQQVAVPLDQDRTAIFSLNAAPAAFVEAKPAFERALGRFASAHAPGMAVGDWLLRAVAVVVAAWALFAVLRKRKQAAPKQTA